MMAVPNLLERIDLRRLHGAPMGSGPISQPCPGHKDNGRPNMYVYPRNAYCFRCGWHAGAFEYIGLVTGLHDMRDIISEAERIADATVSAESAAAIKMPDLDPSVVVYYMRCLEVNPDLRAWLRTRYGLSDATIDAASVGLAPNAFTLPVFTPEGALSNIRFRVRPELEDPAERRYWGLKGYNDFAWFLPPNFRSANLDGDFSFCEILLSQYGRNSIILTEGEFDALALWGLGLPALSGTNGAASYTQIIKRAADLADCRVYVMYDQDEAGAKNGLALAEGLREAGLVVTQVTWDGGRWGKDAAAVIAAGEGVDFFRQMALIADKTS